MLIYLLVGLVIGTILGWFIAKAINNKKSGSEEKYLEIDRNFAAYKATAEATLAAAQTNLNEKQININDLNKELQLRSLEIARTSSDFATITANLANAERELEENARVTTTLTGTLSTAQNDLSNVREELGVLRAGYKSLEKALELETSKVVEVTSKLTAVTSERDETRQHLATSSANNKGLQDLLEVEKALTQELKADIRLVKNELVEKNQNLAVSLADNKALTDKLTSQKGEIEALGKKFNTEFENIANKILDTKTEKFTELNKTNLKDILEPLGENLKEFKTKVEEVYDKESKERFSLGERVKELSALNQVISEDAKNLTKALKGEAKTQGNWGEMILENILERSGLVKNREYFLEHELLDPDGKPLKSDSEGKKMRPDAVIKYPDNRSVIIDSKVSLNAFTRLIATIDPEEQKKELAAHVAAVKGHIVGLSSKGYDDYDKALDFVMLFVPSEPAYIAALQSEPDLWNFAYDKRILLLSPTNLITSLKLIVDLWKREYQNKNAIDIADRGAKLYDKFVLFVENLDDVGKHLDKAKVKYDDAFKQLSTGNDNLVLQADKLKKLGLKTKKDLPQEVINSALSDSLLNDVSKQ